jgi:hypothetical protein
MSNRVTDGLSNTVGLAEHYSFCGDNSGNNLFLFPLSEFPFPSGSHPHPATFADGGPNVPFPNRLDVDNYPVWDPANGITTGSLPGTFQLMPRDKDCDFRYAQTAHKRGMVVSMMDGSVRTLAPHISPTAFWALVTPASGDLPNGEW